MCRVDSDLTVGTSSDPGHDSLIDRRLPAVSSLAANFPHCGQDVLEVFIKVHVFLVSKLCIDCQSFVISVLGRPRSLSNVSTYSRRALHRLCSDSQLMCCAASTRHVASSYSSFALRKASSLSLSMSLSLASFCSSVGAFSSIVIKSASLFARSLPLIVHVIYFSFTRASSTS